MWWVGRNSVTTYFCCFVFPDACCVPTQKHSKKAQFHTSGNIGVFTFVKCELCLDFPPAKAKKAWLTYDVCGKTNRTNFNAWRRIWRKWMITEFLIVSCNHSEYWTHWGSLQTPCEQANPCFPASSKVRSIKAPPPSLWETKMERNC